MGKLFTDATGQAIKEEIKSLTGALRDTMDFAAMELPPSDGKPYVMKDGEWAEALIPTGTPGMDNTPTQTVVNEGGQASVTFYFPWKFAVKTTDTLIADKLKTEWKFPYDEGTIKSVTYRTGNSAASIQFMADGVNILGTSVSASTTGAETTPDFVIKKGQKLEIKVMSAALEATDLTVTFTMDVGHKTIEFIGQADLQPNVYAKGYQANTWSNKGETTPDGQFQVITMPSVTKLWSGFGGFSAKGEDGKIYAVHGNSTAATLAGLPGTANTPTEIPDETVKEVLFGYFNGNYYTSTLRTGGKLSMNGAALTVQGFEEEDGDFTPGLYNLTLNCYKKFGDNHGLVVNPGGSTLYLSLPDMEPIKRCSGRYILSEARELYQYDTSNKFTKQEFPYGKIKNFWADASGNILALNEDNELYARGTPVSGHLGAVSVPTAEFVKVGIFDIKKLVIYPSSTLLLTTSGELYHAGKDTNLFPDVVHNTGFIQVLQNYRFHDIAYCSNGHSSNRYSNFTLVAIAEYLGEIAE